VEHILPLTHVPAERGLPKNLANRFPRAYALVTHIKSAILGWNPRHRQAAAPRSAQGISRLASINPKPHKALYTDFTPRFSSSGEAPLRSGFDRTLRTSRRRKSLRPHPAWCNGYHTALSTGSFFARSSAQPKNGTTNAISYPMREPMIRLQRNGSRATRPQHCTPTPRYFRN